MIEDKRLSIFLRNIISEGGLHYKPGPEIVARQNSEITLNLVIRDLANDKKPFNLLTLGPLSMEFVIRENRYPESEEDILISATGSGGDILWLYGGAVDITLKPEDLDIPTSNYWYDLLIATDDPFIENAAGLRNRPPFGVFKVVK